MAIKRMRESFILALAATVLLSTLPSMASAKRTRPSSGSARAGSGQRSSTGSAGVTRGTGSGRASGRATYGYHGRGRWPGYGYGYGYGYQHYPYYWYLGYPGLFYWRWGWPWLYDGWCGYPGQCNPTVYQVLRLRSDPGVVETDVKPKRAEVVVDGEVVGEARDYNGNWDLLFLQPGLREIRFRAPGYMTLTLWMEVEPGGYLRIKERLAQGEGEDPRSMSKPPEQEKQPATAAAAEESGPTTGPPVSTIRQGLLRIKASPPDAAVYLDGEYLARADELERMHGALPVAQGRHLVEAVRPGYAGESIEIVVGGDEPSEIRLDLERDGG
jgi:hypothetical protein